MKTALYTIISFGLGLAIVIAVGVLAARRRTPRTMMLAALFFCMAFSMLPSILHIRESTDSFPALALLGRLAVFLIGPLLYGYFRILFDPGWRPTFGFGFHFMSLPLVVPAMLLWPTIRSGATAPLPHWLGFHIFGIIALVHIQVYLIVSLYVLYSRRQSVASGPGAAGVKLKRWVVLLIVLYFSGTLLGLLGMILDRRHELAHIAIGFLAFVVALQYVLMQRHPAFLTNTDESEPRGRYERSRLGGVDSRKLRAELDRLMNEEKLYLDEELTLQNLADEIKITPHQLSEFLNDSLGRNFYTYINEYRVQEARRLLREEPDRTVLSIGYAAGFNSKSSFHTAFTRQTGKTPGEYRKTVKTVEGSNG